jgi:hypothetical protein
MSANLTLNARLAGVLSNANKSHVGQVAAGYLTNMFGDARICVRSHVASQRDLQIAHRHELQNKKPLLSIVIAAVFVLPVNLVTFVKRAWF